MRALLATLGGPLACADPKRVAEMDAQDARRNVDVRDAGRGEASDGEGGESIFHEGPHLDNALALALDAKGQQLYILDEGFGGQLLALDLATGELQSLTTLSSMTGPGGGRDWSAPCRCVPLDAKPSS